MNKIAEGYKQTEVGVIPGDWGVITAKDACSKIQDGTHFSPKAGGNYYLYITSKNIRFGFLDISLAARITESQHRTIYKRCDVKSGDLLLTKDGVNTGNAAINTLDEEFSLLSSVAFLRFDPQKHSTGYFLQQILSHQVQKQINNAMVGNAITRLTLEKIKKLCFPLPPTKAEQTVIATALNDADALITQLEKLIAKKRNIKQGAIQKLLNPYEENDEKRMENGELKMVNEKGNSQFTPRHLQLKNGWEVKKLGEVFRFLNTANNARADLLESGEVEYIHYGDIHTRWNCFLDCSKNELPFIDKGKITGVPLLENGDLVIADASEDYEGLGACIEINNIGKRKIIAGLHTLLLRGNKNILADDFKGYLRNYKGVKDALMYRNFNLIKKDARKCVP